MPLRMALALRACTTKHSDEVSTFYCDFGDWRSCVPPLGVLKCGRRDARFGGALSLRMRAIVREQDMGRIQVHGIFGCSCTFVHCLSMYVGLYS